MLNLVVKAVEEQLQAANQKITGRINAETPLLGAGRVVDSIGLVTLIVDVENRVAEEVGKSISLMDDRAMSQSKSPFRTVGSLAEYLQLLVAGDDADQDA